MKKFYFVLGLMAMMCMFSVVSLQSQTTINVPGTYGLTIEAAIIVASSGDTINVAAGTYTPAGGRLVINKSITVQADPSSAVRPKIITNYMGWTDCAIQIAADSVVLQGFEIDNSAANASHLKGYIVGDYGAAKNGWTVRKCDIHNGRNAIRPIGNNITIEYNNLHETESDLINCEYGACFGLKVKGNWLHSHHSDLGGKPAGLTYNVSSTSGADVEVTYNYAWANRTFVDFQNSGVLSPVNHILVAHNTVDFWIGDLPVPIVGNENAEQMSIAWWSSGGKWNAPNFEIRDNLFTRQKWYAVVDTDSNLGGQITLRNNMFWKWYLNDTWYPSYAYSNEWPGLRGAVGWDNMGAGNEFVMLGSITGDPLYAAIGTNPDAYYALTCGSPALGAATDGTNIGAWQEPLQCAPDITVAPTSFYYGSVAFGLSPSTTFTITNDGLAPLTLSSLGLTGTNPTQFSITDPGAFPVGPGAFTTIKANYTPTIVGPVIASLVISTNDPDESPFSIPLSGLGLGPDIDVSQLPYDFGNVDLGATGTNTFTIKNTGNADLTVSGTSIAGAFFSIASGGAPFTLGSGLTRSLVVNFSPTTEGLKTATLSLTSNDPDEGTVTVSLSGTGKSIAMKTFEIEEAKLDWKKKPDDDKIHVKGTYNLPAGASPGPSVTLFVQNLPPFGPVTMDVKENGKKWEYKRPKNGTGFIKEMTIDWKAKEAKFDIHLDDANLGVIESWMNPVTFVLQIGYYKDSETVTMKTHKDKWEYHN